MPAYVARPTKRVVRMPPPGEDAPDVTAGTLLGPGETVDTSAEAGGLGGFLGFVGSTYFSLTNAKLIVGLRIQSSGTFTILEVGDEEETPEASLQFTCYRIFDDQQEAESKLSATPEIDIADGSWSGTAAKALENPVLLEPGNYRVDFTAALNESREFDTVPDVDIVLVAVRFEPLFVTAPNGVPVAAARSYTQYNLETGAAGKTYYEFPGDNDPPLAIDMVTVAPKGSSDISLLRWVAKLLVRAIGEDVGDDHRRWLTDNGYIENRWLPEIHELPETGGGGATVEQQTYKEAIGRILFEMGAAFDWTGPYARIIVIPTTAPTSVRTITLDDIERVSLDDPIPELNISYTDSSEVVNSISARYRRDYSQSSSFEAYESPVRKIVHSTWQILGEQTDDERFWLDWILEGNQAAALTNKWSLHLGQPKKIVEFVGFLDLVEFQRGDIIAFDLQPNITIGPSPGSEDANQGYGLGGYGSAGYGGSVIIPSGTIIGETFDGLTPDVKFMIEQSFVNWDSKRVLIKAREVP